MTNGKFLISVLAAGLISGFVAGVTVSALTDHSKELNELKEMTSNLIEVYENDPDNLEDQIVIISNAIDYHSYECMCEECINEESL